MVDSRECVGCGATKLLSEFSLAPRGKFGRKARCKACDAERHRAQFVPAVVDEDAKRERYTRNQVGPKTCENCGVSKDRSAFSKSRQGKYGPVLMSWCKECTSVRALQWFHDNHERALTNGRHWRMVATYGITVQEYNEMSAAQGHVCAVCGKPESRTRNGETQHLAVDHCHDTGRVRGLLCNNCNRALGLLKDDADVLRKAIGYLERK
jgi:hypothetical protein